MNTDTLNPIQQQVFDTAKRYALPSTKAASGHDIREYLLKQGMDKRVIAETLGELVELNVLERVKITERSGMFYTAYRVASKG